VQAGWRADVYFSQVCERGEERVGYGARVLSQPVKAETKSRKENREALQGYVLS